MEIAATLASARVSGARPFPAPFRKSLFPGLFTQPAFSVPIRPDQDAFSSANGALAAASAASPASTEKSFSTFSSVTMRFSAV